MNALFKCVCGGVLSGGVDMVWEAGHDSSLPWGLFVFQIAEPEACDQMYESLARLHSNYYKHKVSGPSLLYPQPSDWRGPVRTSENLFIQYFVKNCGFASFKCNQSFLSTKPTKAPGRDF